MRIEPYAPRFDCLQTTRHGWFDALSGRRAMDAARDSVAIPFVGAVKLAVNLTKEKKGPHNHGVPGNR